VKPRAIGHVRTGAENLCLGAVVAVLLGAGIGFGWHYLDNVIGRPAVASAACTQSSIVLPSGFARGSSSRCPPASSFIPTPIQQMPLTPETLTRYYVNSAAGQPVPLSNLVTLKTATEPNAV
jgi:hypothetical protein